jgi:DNA-binding NarL/FixJ family response regulator
VTDPVARTSFRNIFGYALAATAHFDEATRLTDEQLHDVDRCRLDFVRPYALTIHALVASGQRSYATSASLLDEADERASNTGDASALQLSTAVRMRLLIAQASFEAAASRAGIDLSDATRSLRGELLGVQALALAGLGQARRSAQLAASALDASIGVESGIAANCALAVCALNQDHQDEALRRATAALARAVHTGMIESFVSAYRGCPELLVCLLQDRKQHAPLESVLARAGDKQLVPDLASSDERSVMSLSPREKEVLALMAQGLSNAEIGRTLFISPVTVKVHARHIYEKLGVRSRAAAVLRASQLGRD